MGVTPRGLFFIDSGTLGAYAAGVPVRSGAYVAYQPRTYRRAVDAGLCAFEVVLATTDLQILASSDLSDPATAAASEARSQVEDYVVRHPRFGDSFVPVPVDASAGPVVVEMARAAEVAGVGPMAAVAGAVAEYVARALWPLSDEVIVENGGDVYLCGSRDRTVALWAGENGARGVGIELSGTSLPLAVATSSATVGPSISLGRADAATVIARSGALADAAASAVGNRVRSASDLEAGLAVARGIGGVLGCVVSVDGALAAWGDLKLVGVDVLG